ncbi:MAG: SRPBCC domain-containing protein [Bacteroidetes bacterium]|nr:SRPBCC domain-containing protein [Bacteroidota bacterium]
MLKDMVLQREVRINAPAEKVWLVLTDPILVKRYLYGTTMTAEPYAGGSIRFTGVWEGTEYVDKGTVTGYTPNEYFAYSYYSSFSPLPDLPENYAAIAFTIVRQPSGSLLQLEQRGFADEAAYRHSLENWGSILDTMKALAEE